MKPFSIRASLATPVLRRGYMTLDALLMATLNTGDVSHLIRCEEGLYRASAAFGRGLAVRWMQPFVASMRPDTSPHWAEILQPNTHDKDFAIDVAKAKYGGTVMNVYSAESLDSLVWWAVGDGPAVFEILEEIAFLGKGRTSGWGQVKRWSLEPYAGDGLYAEGGLPLRPIPVHLVEDCVAPDLPTVDRAWKPPYWNMLNRARCIAPQLLEVSA